MDYNQQKLSAILEKKELTAEDRLWLLELFNQPGMEDEVKRILQEQFLEHVHDAPESQSPGSLQLLNTIHQRLALSPQRSKKTFLLRPAVWAAAASVIAAVLFISLWVSQKPNNPPLTVTQTQVSQQALVRPGTTGAILTLSDGSTIVLDSAANGALSSDAGANIIKQGSSIIYKGRSREEATTYNTMTTPNGRQFQLMLADGSKVWLNAASSIRFPTVFSGPERTVEVTGEAYFEVKKDAAKPFKVKTGGTYVEVLGTHFNVNSYDPSTRITLLEGSVKVVNGAVAMLKPGEQASVHNGIQVSANVNLEEVMAWKNGHFLFENADLQSIMRLIARWYDVQVVYQGDIPMRTFSADLSQKTELNNFLKVLEESGVHFRLEGKKLIVHN